MSSGSCMMSPKARRRRESRPGRAARLGDTKTGISVRPLSRAACELLKVQSRIEGRRVFLATRGDDAPLSLKKFWPRIGKLGGLPVDISLHVLRHSFASLAGDL